MNLHIICVGKLKESYWRDACAQYQKRLSRFARITVTELPDEAIPERASAAEEQAVLRKEGERILAACNPREELITLCVEGKQMSSVGLADQIASAALRGCSDLAFVIGGSLGLSEAVKAKSRLRLSFSEMTFPHQLMRVILLEQLYRAFKINAHETYHK